MLPLLIWSIEYPSKNLHYGDKPICTNRVDSDETAPTEAVWSKSALFAFHVILVERASVQQSVEWHFVYYNYNHL